MIGIIYIRSIAAIIGICGMMCYLKAIDSIPEAIAGIIMAVYIDKQVSGTDE